MKPLEFLDNVQQRLDSVVSANGLIYCGYDITQNSAVQQSGLSWDRRESQLVARVGRAAAITNAERKQPIFVSWNLERRYALPTSIDEALIDTGYAGNLSIVDGIADTNDPNYGNRDEPIQYFEEGGVFVQLRTDFTAIKGHEQGIPKAMRDKIAGSTSERVYWDKQLIWNDGDVSPETVIPKVLAVLPRIVAGEFGGLPVFR